MVKGIFRHPVRNLTGESLSRFFTNNKKVWASPSPEARTICLSLYQKLFQSLKKYGQRKAKWIISSFSVWHSRHLSSPLLRSQGAPDCSPKFPMSRNCRFRLGTKSGYSDVIDQKVSKVSSANADTFLDTDPCEIANSVQYLFSSLLMHFLTVCFHSL